MKKISGGFFKEEERRWWGGKVVEEDEEERGEANMGGCGVRNRRKKGVGGGFEEQRVWLLVDKGGGV